MPKESWEMYEQTSKEISDEFHSLYEEIQELSAQRAQLSRPFGLERELYTTRIKPVLSHASEYIQKSVVVPTLKYASIAAIAAGTLFVSDAYEKSQSWQTNVLYQPIAYCKEK